MRLRFVILTYAILPVLGFCGSSFALDAASPSAAPNYHACTQAELTSSIWKMILLREQPQGKDTIFYNKNPYRYIAFYPNHQFVVVIQPSEIKAIDEVQKAISAHLLKNNASYILDEKGRLYIYRGKKAMGSYTCSIINAEMQGYKKGDMALGENTVQKTQEFQLFRHF